MYFLKNINIHKLHWLNFFIIKIRFMMSGNDENDTYWKLNVYVTVIQMQQYNIIINILKCLM